jgi:hypothetical protein
VAQRDRRNTRGKSIVSSEDHNRSQRSNDTEAFVLNREAEARTSDAAPYETLDEAEQAALDADPSFKLAWEDLPEFGLAQVSAAQGRNTLESAGSVYVARQPGLTPVATIQLANAADALRGGVRCRIFSSGSGRS